MISDDVADMRKAAHSHRRTEPSRNEAAYESLKDGLITLAYRPGDYLNTADLMADLQIGRTPINHALHRLAAEGLVQVMPRKGVMVAPLSLDDALDLIDVRLANETLCVRLAAKRITAEELQQLEHTSQQMALAVEARQILKVMGFDRQFHEQIAAASMNPVLIEILRVLHARSQRFWALSLSAEGHLDEVIREHAQVLVALSARDGGAAASAVELHVKSFQQSLLQRG